MTHEAGDQNLLRPEVFKGFPHLLKLPARKRFLSFAQIMESLFREKYGRMGFQKDEKF